MSLLVIFLCIVHCTVLSLLANGSIFLPLTIRYDTMRDDIYFIYNEIVHVYTRNIFTCAQIKSDEESA